MPDALLEVLITFPAQAIIAWGFTTLLPMRKRLLFWFLNVGVIVFLDAVGELFLGFWAGLVLIALVSFVLPCLLYRGKVVVRICAMVVANVIGAIAQFLANLLMVVISGADIPDEMPLYYDYIRDNMFSFAISEIVQIVVLLLLFVLASKMFGKWRSGSSVGIAGSWAAGLFLFAQLAFFVLATYECSLQEGPLVLWIAVLVVTIACAVSDLLILRYLESAQQKAIEDQRAAMLQQQLDHMTSEYDALTSQVNATLRFRHDLRNHMQTACALVGKGEVEAAKSQIAELRSQALDGGSDA